MAQGDIADIRYYPYQGIGTALDDLEAGRIGLVIKLFPVISWLTRERPEVGRILTFGSYSEEQILQWAAAAEYKFTHPIAKAILAKFESLGLPMAKTDEDGVPGPLHFDAAHLHAVGPATIDELEGYAGDYAFSEVSGGAINR